MSRFFERFKQSGLVIGSFRADCGSCSENIVSVVEKNCQKFHIRANRCDAFYEKTASLEGWKEVKINGIEFELHSISIEKWKGKQYRLVIQRQRRTDNEQDIWDGEYTYRCILTNDYEASMENIIEYYNQRGGKERIFDDMNNGFGWKRLPKSVMAANTAFLLLTAMIRNFYKAIMQKLDVEKFGLKKTSRIKAFVFKFISVPAKWVKTERQHVLNVYTENQTYKHIFLSDFG